MKTYVSKKFYTRTEARNHLPSMLDRVSEGEGPIYITGRNNLTAVLISDDDYKKLSKKKKVKFSEKGLVGIFKDRKDMENSVKWVEELRKREDERSKEFWTKKHE